MNISGEMKKTLVFVSVAFVLAAGAVYTRAPVRYKPTGDFGLQGEKFFPEFKDPLECTSLEVVGLDPDTSSPVAFKVMLKDGKWVIPSHYNYPADAKDRLAKTAAGIIDLTRDVLVSDRAADYDSLGVSDPTDMKSYNAKGTGKRVTLRDKTDRILADFIIGDEVVDRAGMRYVRVPSEKMTYAVKADVDLSTRFADWIETNLLKLDSSKIRRVTFVNHKVDPERGKIIPGETLTIERSDSNAPWKLDKIAEGQEINTDTINTLISALSDLKISGVRPKPDGLTRDLKGGEGIRLDQAARISLGEKGFYIVKDQLISNQGDVIVECDDGAQYTLRFGEVVFARGEALSSGKESKDKKKADDPKSKNEGSIESRYLFATIAFFPELLPPPADKTDETISLPDEPFLLPAGDPKRVADEKKIDDERKKKDDEKKKRLEEAKKGIDERSDRFAPWYYLVPGDAFRNIVLDRSALTKAKGKLTPTGATGGPELGLPPGINPVPDGLLNPK
jgi:hypothetical protein